MKKITITNKGRLSVISFGYYLLVGAYLALVQFAYYFLMSFNLSSTYLSYIGMTFFWLIGSLVGVWMKETGLERWLLLFNTLSFYLFVWLSFNLRFNNHLYYFFFALVAIAGIFPGYFFAQNHKRSQKVKWLFFMENNGFILGMILSFGLFSYWGVNFLYIAPLVITVCLLLIKFFLPPLKKSVH